MKKMFAKFLAVVLCVVMTLTAAPLGGFAGLELPSLFDFEVKAAVYSGTCGENLTWSLDIGTGELDITGTGAMTNWSSYSSVPWYSYRNSINALNIGNSVTSIGDFAFYSCTCLTIITIPDNITAIGNSAFEFCESLLNVTIGNGVTAIGDSVFASCYSLADITIGNCVKTIGDFAFGFCCDLTSITLPDSVTSIGYEAFYECSDLTSVVLGDGITTIGDEAFYCCTYLTTITIPDSVTVIGDNAFYECSSLTNITIPAGVTKIHIGTFFGCTSLTSITVDANNKNYTSDSDGIMFNKDKTELVQYPAASTRTSYTIPDGVTTIGYGAFYGCSNLANITISDSVTTIGQKVFLNSYSLESITIPDSVTTIGYGAFEDCSNFNEVYYGGTEEDWNKITIGTNNEPLTSATIHFTESEVSIIDSGECGENLTWTLYETGLLEVSGTGPMYNGLDAEDYPWWIYGSSIKSVVIGDGITTLSEYAFHWWYPNLTDIIIPDSVTIIGDFAFSDCQSLTNITIPDSVITICINAFYCCKNLTTITIGKSVIGIGTDAFSGCSNLTDVYYNSTEENWEKISIDSGNDSLISATIHFNDGGIEPGVADYTLLNDAKESFENLFSDDYTADSWAAAERAYADACAIPDDLTVNEQHIIDELTDALTEAIDGLVANPINEYEVSGRCGSRANWSFNQLTGVLKITGSGAIVSWSNPDDVPWYEYACDIRAVGISKDITKIGDYSFYGCENLTSISIPDKVRTIGAYAFSGCERLMKVQFGNSIESIGEFAFENCSLIRRITFPNSLKSLSGGVFIYCSSLVSISIPAGVTSLGDFYDINEGDIDIYFGGTKDEWDELCWDDLPDNITVKFVNYQPGDVFADYSKVEAALECVPEDLTVYSDESLSRLYHALNSVVCYLEIFYQNEVDNFAAEIEDAVLRLEYNRLCDYTQLNEALDEYYELSVFSDNYTADTWHAVEQAFETARVIPEDLFVDVKGENQQMIDEATLALLEAINNLIREEKADKTALLAAIYSVYDYNADEYTADSWQRVAVALAYAECVNADESASQQMIDVATAELEVALHSLVKKADKTALVSAIVLAKSYENDGYTDDSWKAFVQALENAQTVLDDDNAMQETVDLAETTLRTAMLNLKPEDDNIVSDPCKDGHDWSDGNDLCVVCGITGGTCGESLNWSLDNNGHLEITGTGREMKWSDYSVPWYSYRKRIITANICNSVMNIHDGAFKDCDNLTSITIPDSVTTIGDYALYECISLTDVYYGGTEEEWSKITIGSDNGPLTSATVHYGYGKPSITPANGAVVDSEIGTIYGLDAGVNSLDGYTELVDGCEWSYEEGQYGFGTGTVAALRNGDEIVAEYTIIIFGDVQGDGWYDGEDAFLVNLIVNGLLDKEDVGEAMWTAADCNHDGVIDESDVDLLTGAGLLLNNVDQTKTQAELATDSAYIEYAMIIDQSAGMDTGIILGTDDAQAGESDASTAPAQSENEISIEAIITSLFDFFKKLFSVVFSFIAN